MGNAISSPTRGYRKCQMTSLEVWMDLRATEIQQTLGIWVDPHQDNTQESRLILVNNFSNLGEDFLDI